MDKIQFDDNISRAKLNKVGEAVKEYKKANPASRVSEKISKVKNLSWEQLAIYYFNDISRFELLKRLNGNVKKPADLMNTTQKAFCAVSDDYCEIKGIKVDMEPGAVKKPADDKESAAAVASSESKTNTKKAKKGSKVGKTNGNGNGKHKIRLKATRNGNQVEFEAVNLAEDQSIEGVSFYPGRTAKKAGANVISSEVIGNKITIDFSNLGQSCYRGNVINLQISGPGGETVQKIYVNIPKIK